jgi:serine/threonine-protein kinase
MFADQRGTLGKYHLIAEIARGGMGIVYLALIQGKAGFNKLVVVKELKAELVEDPGFLTMFLDEARLAARLSHPNIVQTHEIGNEGERHYMALEYLDGRTYERVRKRSKNLGNRLTLHMQLRVISDVLAGLEYAHTLADFDGTKLEVVHRDVTPNNVFITFDGHVKLLDFGIAKAADQTHETQAGVLKGKVAYMAPEQAAGKKVDARADVFSAGVMLWEAVAGRRLRSGNAADIVKALTEDVPRLSAEFPDVPDQLDHIVAKATANDRERRYPSAAAFQADVDDLLAKLGGAPTPREVGAVVAELFKDDRAKTNALIETYVTRARQGQNTLDNELPVIELLNTPPQLQTPTPGRMQTQTTIESSFGSISVVESVGAQNVEPAAASINKHLPPAPASSKKGLMIGVAAVVVLGGGAVFALTRGGDKTAAATPDAAKAAAVESRPTVEEPKVSAPSTPPAAVPTIELAIDARPATATITIDDAVVSGNPFTGKYRKDGVMHRIRVAAPGFDAQTRDIPFDRDVTLVLELKAPPPKVVTNVASARAKPPVTTARTVPKPVVKEPEPVAPKPPDIVKPKPPEPAQFDPKGGQKPVRTIDSKNPYGGSS